ncbi:MAG: hypothetical protein ACC657_05505 [Thiohalomonadales bacterium]
MNKYDKYLYAVNDAKSDNNLSIKNTIAFHYFNENGIYNKKKEINELIFKAVEQGKCKSGAILAYGSADNFATELLQKMFTRKQNSRAQISSMLSMFDYSISSAKEFLNKL